MWIVFWDGGIEAYNTMEEARFVYFILKNNGHSAGIKYLRNYL